MPTIKIFLCADNEGDLHLRDSNGQFGKNDLKTFANKKDKIVWLLERDSGIKKINGIIPKQGTKDIFKSKPSGKSPKKWKGVIGDEDDVEYLYDISYTLIDGKEKTIDPKIVVLPPNP